VACLAAVLGIVCATSALAAPAGVGQAQESELEQARQHLRNSDLPMAIQTLEKLVAKRHSHPNGEIALNLLLDTYVRDGRFERMTALVEELLADKKFLAAKPGLRKRLQTIRVQASRMRAERLERDGDSQACGRAYQAIYTTTPNGPRMDQVLYNAGVCFEQAKSPGSALEMFALIRQRFPRSRVAQKALVRAANLYAVTASFEKAADHYEAYATMYAGEKDAPAALSNAVHYRRGLAQYDRAISNIELFVRHYKRKYKREAADALFSIAGIHQAQQRPDKEILLLQRYLREFGSAGGRERVLVAHAKIGELLWKQSRRGTRPIASPRARNGVLVAKARKHFRLALRVWKRLGHNRALPEERARLEQATFWYGAARFYLTEPMFEMLLSNPRPADHSALADQVSAELSDVQRIAGALDWRIASAARKGQVFDHLGQREKASAAFAACLDASKELNRFNEFSRLCERRLSRLQPNDFPPMTELRGTPELTPVLGGPGPIIEQD